MVPRVRIPPSPLKPRHCRNKETVRTADRTPRAEAVTRGYFADGHPGGPLAFCSRADRLLTDGSTWKAVRSAVKGSRWHALRGDHAFRHSFPSNLAAAGVDQRVIGELMGHTAAGMRKRYRHPFPDRRRAARMGVFGG